MKKLLALILAAAMALSLVACGGGADTPTASPDETPSEEVTAPQETKEQEEPTETMEEEPTEEVSEPVGTEPIAEGDTQKSALYDESGNLVSMDEFIHEYQYLLSLEALYSGGEFYTISKPEDSNISYYLYHHASAKSDGVQTSTSMSFANDGEVVGADGRYNQIILNTIYSTGDSDSATRHILAVAELMYAIDPSTDEDTYLEQARSGVLSGVTNVASGHEDYTYVIELNNSKCTFTTIMISESTMIVGVNVEF